MLPAVPPADAIAVNCPPDFASKVSELTASFASKVYTHESTQTNMKISRKGEAARTHYSTNWQRIKSLCVGYPPECFEIYFQEVMSRKERTYEGIEAVLRYSEASRLALLTVPTLLMWAMEDTSFTPFIEDTARLVPHSTTEVLHGSGFHILIQKSNFILLFPQVVETVLYSLYIIQFSVRN